MTQQDPKTTDTTSLATTLVNSQDQDQEPEQPKRQSWLRRHLPGGSKSSSSPSSSKEKKDSISDSGPFIFAFDPAQGKEVLQKNPHWPNEDTWKREEEMKGQWAMGGEMGQANRDFGGTVA